MFSLEMLRDLYAHMEWAAAKVWSAARKTEGASSDGLLRDKLFHVHRTQRAYLNMWTNQPQQIRHHEDFANLVTLLEWAHPYYAEVRGFLEAADSSALDRPVPDLFRQRMAQHLGRSVANITLRETVLDLASHTTHHRGQLNTQLRELGGEPPLVDYIAWVWHRRPGADWPPDVGAIEGGTGVGNAP